MGDRMTMKEREQFAKTITLYRAEHSLSLAEFAEQCKLTIQTISNVERCLQRPSRLTVAKIMNVIGDE